VITTKEINICKIVNKEKTYIENISKFQHENNLIINEKSNKQNNNVIITNNTETENNKDFTNLKNQNSSNNNQSYFYNNRFDIWNGENNNYCLAIIKNLSNVEIFKIYENSLDFEKIFEINPEFKNIQSIFYNKMIIDFKEPILNGITNLNKNITSNEGNSNLKNNEKNPEKNNYLYQIKNNGILFIVDGDGIYIKAFKINTKEKKINLISCFYRGNSNSLIYSVILLNKNTAALSSSNKTIHIFEIKNINNNDEEKSKNNNICNRNSKSYFGNFLEFIKNPFQLNKSIIKIRLNELIESHEDSGIYENDLINKGNILFFEKENSLLKVLAYNGKLYYIKIDFVLKDYILTKIYDWSSFSKKIKIKYLDKNLFCENFEVLNDSLDKELMNKNEINIHDLINESEFCEFENNLDNLKKKKNFDAICNESEIKQHEYLEKEINRENDSVLISIDDKNIYSDNVCFNKENSNVVNKDYDKWKII